VYIFIGIPDQSSILVAKPNIYVAFLFYAAYMRLMLYRIYQNYNICQHSFNIEHSSTFV